MSSIDPMSDTSANETSVTMSSDRALPWRNPLPVRLLLSFSVVFKSMREC
jgi:hypothetical protein